MGELLQHVHLVEGVFAISLIEGLEEHLLGNVLQPIPPTLHQPGSAECSLPNLLLPIELKKRTNYCAIKTRCSVRARPSLFLPLSLHATPLAKPSGHTSSSLARWSIGVSGSAVGAEKWYPES